jgi:hypothetical protein
MDSTGPAVVVILRCCDHERTFCCNQDMRILHAFLLLPNKNHEASFEIGYIDINLDFKGNVASDFHARHSHFTCFLSLLLTA